MDTHSNSHYKKKFHVYWKEQRNENTVTNTNGHLKFL
jgi:hypothetical protein